LPFAPIAKPWDLLDDLHLKASGGLLETRVQGKTIRVPALPLELGGKRLPKRTDPPTIGEHGPELLAELGCSPQQIRELQGQNIVRLPHHQLRAPRRPLSLHLASPARRHHHPVGEDGAYRLVH